MHILLSEKRKCRAIDHIQLWKLENHRVMRQKLSVWDLYMEKFR